MMAAKANQRTAIEFLFTPDGFTPDTSSLDSEAELREARRWEADGGYPALYESGLEGKPKDAGPSESFLYQVAAVFFQQLTDLPELEIARGKAKVVLSDEAANELLFAVPFAIGAEYITKKWLRSVFQKLQSIFSKEIAVYDGTVEMYLTEKNQALRVPERVFFNLVENKVVLAVPDDNPADIHSFEDLGTDKPSLICLGNDDVPVGAYSKEILTGLGIMEQLEASSKITYGSNVKEVTTQVKEASVDCGIIYATDAFSAGLNVVDEAEEGQCRQVIYPAAVLNISENQEEARTFLDYLLTDQCAEIFEAVGFTMAQ